MTKTQGKRNNGDVKQQKTKHKMSGPSLHLSIITLNAMD